jgi:bacteriorhodopsin
MKRKWISRLAWILCGLISLLALATAINALVNRAADDSLIRVVGGIVWNLFPMVFAFLAALIIAQRPRNLTGWLLMLPAVGFALGNPADVFLGSLTSAPAAPTLAFWLVVWYDSWYWVFLVIPLLLIPLVFPSGSPISRRWQWVFVAVVGLGVFVILLMTFSQEIGPAQATWTVSNPVGFISNQLLEVVIPPWVLILGMLTLLCAASIMVRFRRASAVERAQIKWLLYACGLFVAAYAPLLVLNVNTEEWLSNDLLDLLFTLAVLTIPAAIVIAILRYRLWDIDLIIRKTMVYVGMTALLALVYFGLVTLLQNLISSLIGNQQSPISIVISTLAIAALFNPLRRRVQNFIDRRFYRRKYNAERALAQFAVIARDEVDQESLTAALVGVVHETIQPENASLWLKNRSEN